MIRNLDMFKCKFYKLIQKQENTKINHAKYLQTTNNWTNIWCSFTFSSIDGILNDCGQSK